MVRCVSSRFCLAVVVALLVGAIARSAWAADLFKVKDLNLTYLSETGEKEPLRYIEGSLPAGTGVDVLWTRNAIYLMRKPDEIRRIWATEDPNHGIERATFDGKFVWLPMRPDGQPPYLIVLDPKRGTYATITTKDGLRKIEPDKFGAYRLLASGTSEGKAILAGGTADRVWLATAHLTPGGRREVKVFHEAAEAPVDDKESWKKPTVLFRPAYCYLVAGHDKKGKVLVGRYSNPVHDVTLHPLVVEADTRAVRVLEDQLSGQDELFDHGLHAGAVYQVHQKAGVPYNEKALDLRRLAAPSLIEERLLTAPEGWVVFHGKQFHILGKHWWTGNLEAGKIEKALDQVPWRWSNRWVASPPTDNSPLAPKDFRLEGVWPSQHYGLLMVLVSNELGSRIITVDNLPKGK